MTAPVVRPMREEDLAAFAEITATSYHEVDTRTHQRAWPDPVRRPADRNGPRNARGGVGGAVGARAAQRCCAAEGLVNSH